jgi:sulfatase maturation enzyme AslB (radical SAM superfamily)
MKHLVCSNMWNHIGINVAQQNITHCCKMTHVELTKDDLQNLDGELNRVSYFVDQKKQFVDTNSLPETCRKCSETWPNSVWKTWNKWQDKDWTKQELDLLISSDKTRNIDIFLSTTCNLACTYCNEGYSSRWAEIKGLARTEDEEWKQLMLNNLYKYIEKYHANYVREDRMSYSFLGGEPLLNLEIFDVLQNIMSLYAAPTKRVQFNITTNLCVKPKVVENLLELIKRNPGFTWVITPSIDAVGKRAEEIRDGLDFELFASNLKTLADSKLIDSINIQPAVNCVSVKYYSELIDWLTTIFDPQQFGETWNIRNNLVLAPLPMIVNVLPDNYKQYIDNCIQSTNVLKDGVSKIELCEHLENVKNNIGTRRDTDAKDRVRKFFEKYGALKNKDYFELFPELKDILE